MIDAAEVLAKEEVQTAMLELIAAAAIAYGVKPNHAREMGGKFVATIVEGAPVISAIALVDAIQLHVHETDDEEEEFCAHGLPFAEDCEECDLEDLEDDDDVDG